MNSRNTSTLAQKKNLRIVHFDACGHIGFMYKNLLLNFQTDGFQQFSDSFQQLDFERRSVTFPDGSRRLVMNTCRKEIQLCFERDEFKMVKEALQEACLMLEVNEILYSEQDN